jgi:hypothetical protein
LSSRRDLRRRLALSGTAVLLTFASTACSGGGGGDVAAAATPATAKLASIEAAHVCAVTHQTYLTEDAIEGDLLDRLDAQGLDRAGWKRWHDSLVASPARARQLATASAEPCPAVPSP